MTRAIKIGILLILVPAGLQMLSACRFDSHIRPESLLREAIKEGDLDEVQYLEQSGRIRKRDGQLVRVALTDALEKKHDHIARFMIEKDLGATALMCSAASLGHTWKVKALLDLGMDPKGRYKGKTFLECAAKARRLEKMKKIIELLVARGADIRAPHQKLLAPALHRKKKDHVKALIAMGAPVDKAADGLLDTMNDIGFIRIDILKENLEILDVLRAAGAPVDEGRLNGKILKVAIRKKDKALIDKTLAEMDPKQGAPLAELLNENLDKVAREQMPATVLALLNGGAKVDAEDAEGHTAIAHAVTNWYIGAAILLVHAGADLSQARRMDFTKQSLLAVACRAGNKELVNLLLAKGVNLDDEDTWGNTPLMTALGSGNDEVGLLLIQRGADVNARNQQGRSYSTSAILLAARRGTEDSFKEILKRITRKITEKEAQRLLYLITARCGDLATMKKLAKLGPKPDGNKALWNAAMCGDLELTRWLVAQGADPKAPSTKGWTPARMAATHAPGNPVLSFLLSKGATLDPKLKTSLPLFHAATMQDMALAKRLLDQGADPNIKNAWGYTPMDVAYQHGDGKMKALLVSRGGKHAKERKFYPKWATEQVRGKPYTDPIWQKTYAKVYEKEIKRGEALMATIRQMEEQKRKAKEKEQAWDKGVNWDQFNQATKQIQHQVNLLKTIKY